MATVTVGGRAYEVEVRGDVVVVDGHEFPITRRVEDGFTVIKAGGQRYRVEVADGASGGTIEAQVDHRPFTFQIEGNLGGGASTARAARPARGRSTASGQKGAIVAPMAGTVLKHVAAVGDAVEAGAVVLIMEAMKMENEIKAPSAGTVKELPVAPGGKVSDGDVLAVVE